MYRREFITLVGGAAVAWPLAARAQQTGSVPRVGVLYPGPMGSAPPRVGAIVEGLRAAGFAQVEVVLRVTEGDSSRIALMVTDIIASKVDVFMAISAAVIRAAQSATQTIPIVGNDLESDPVDTGWAASLSHPGGNITGVFLAFPDFAAKWLELLRDTLPRLTRVTILWDPSTGIFQKQALRAQPRYPGSRSGRSSCTRHPISMELLIWRSEKVSTPSSYYRPHLSVRMSGKRPSLRPSTICRRLLYSLILHEREG